MTGLNNGLRRLTAEIDQRTGEPMVIELTPHTLRIRAKGHRGAYVIPWKAVWLLGAKIKAETLKAEKKQRQIERKKLREGK